MKTSPSEYRDYKIADLKTKMKAAVADFSVFFCLCLVFFGGIFLPLGDYFPFIAQAKSHYQQDSETILSFVSDTRLQKTAEDGKSLVPVETGFTKAITRLIRTTYYYHQNDSSEPLLYTELDGQGTAQPVSLALADTLNATSDYSADDLSYYFLCYREQNKAIMPVSYSIDNTDYSDNFYRFYYLGILGMQSSDQASYWETGLDFTKPLLQESLLTKQTAFQLHDYVMLNTTETGGKDIYAALLSVYSAAVSYGIKEIESSNSTYISLLKTFLADYASYKRNQTLPLTLSYLAVFLVYYLLLPLIFRHGQTLGMRVFHLTYETLDGGQPTVLHFLVRLAVLFLSELWVVALPPILLGQFSLLTVSLCSGVRYLYFIVFSALLGLASLLLFSLKKEHLFLADYASRLQLKDTTKYLPPKEPDTPKNQDHSAEIAILTGKEPISDGKSSS
ncbi:MAG: RDD family protein [Bacilli bacterium]|jgi:uncharacterized RDD family membrane protein YckC|nr:RDD family protein [Bacilli bacterium]